MNRKVEPKILAGFAELLPPEQILFNQMLGVIRRNYELFGFVPLDTPIIERADVLLAKAGGETEKQIYRFSRGEEELALRFDLTVPLARYVSQHYHSLVFPFRRYQIGKVFRGERQQKGRFREFYHCDIDVIGEGELSLLNDAEMPAIIYSIFKEFNFGDFFIKINNRKILNGLFAALNISDYAAEALRIIDKLLKIGAKAAKQELTELGINKDAVEKIFDFVEISGAGKEVVSKLENLDIANSLFINGIKELKEVLQYAESFDIPEDILVVDLTIVRGLDYYTGTVYETFLKDYPEIGSVCSGGRFDNLAEFYTDKKFPGVGISIGLTRLFDRLVKEKIICPRHKTLSKALVAPMTENIDTAIKIAAQLRSNGIAAEIYFGEAKIGKKIDYANKLGIPFVIIIGQEEIDKRKITLKNLASGEQKEMNIEEAVNLIKS